MKVKPLVLPQREPASVVDAATDRVWAAGKQREWEETVRLAEQIFPKDWNVRVEQFSDSAYVQVRIVVAHGRDPIDALKKAIDWYRGQARIVLPGAKR